MNTELLKSFYGKSLGSLRRKFENREKADQYLLDVKRFIEIWSQPERIDAPKRKLENLRGALKTAEARLSEEPNIIDYLRFKDPDIVSPFEEIPPYPYSDLPNILHEYAKVVDQALQDLSRKKGRPIEYHKQILLDALVKSYKDIFGICPSTNRESDFHKAIIILLGLAGYERVDVEKPLSQSIKKLSL